MNCLWLLLAALLSAGPTPGEPGARWPLEFYDGYSSVVGEFRSTHLHAGLDLRTRRETGFPVLAIAGGSVIRLGLAQTGAGRSLVLRHDDGRVSVYDHLQRFSPALEEIRCEHERLAGRKFFGYYYPATPLRVKAGEVIAFSGESGVGFPHLHVEIRAADGTILDPLTVLPFPGNDHSPPACRTLLLRSRGATLVNGRLGETVVPLVTRLGVASPLAVPVIGGPVDLVLQALDLSDSGNQVSPARISGTLDGRPCLSWAVDRLVPADLSNLGAAYDLEHSSVGDYWLNLWGGPRQSFAHGDPLGAGFAELADGAHTLEFTLADHLGNVSTMRLDFVKNSRFQAEPTAIQVRSASPRLFLNREAAWLLLPRATGPDRPPLLRIESAGTSRLLTPQPTQDAWAFLLPVGYGRMNLRMEPPLAGSHLPTGPDGSLCLLTVGPDSSARFGLGAAQVEFPAGAVDAPRTFLLDASAEHEPPGAVCAAVRLSPARESFAAEVAVSFTPPAPVADPEQLFVCRAIPDSAAWIWLSTRWQQGTGACRTLVRQGGAYALCRDSSPPRLGLLWSDASSLAQIHTLFIPLRDGETGVDAETVLLTLNGQPVTGEYDADRRLLRLDLTDGACDARAFLLPGRNTVVCTAMDRAKNRASREYSLVLR